jgi:predicted transcriptional regulator YdeE
MANEPPKFTTVEQQLEAQSRPFRDKLAELSIQVAEAQPSSVLSGESSSFQEEVLQKPALMVVGIECRTSNIDGAAARDIPRLSQKFSAENVMSRIPNRVSDDVIVLYCDYEGDYTKPYTCVMGCAVTSIDHIPAGMVAKTVPASTFAVFQAKGEFPQSVAKTWGYIWQSDLSRTYAGDYEVYGQKFATDQEVAVLVAIKKGSGIGQ